VRAALCCQNRAVAMAQVKIGSSETSIPSRRNLTATPLRVAWLLLVRTSKNIRVSNSRLIDRRRELTDCRVDHPSMSIKKPHSIVRSSRRCCRMPASASGMTNSQASVLPKFFNRVFAKYLRLQTLPDWSLEHLRPVCLQQIRLPFLARTLPEWKDCHNRSTGATLQFLDRGAASPI